MFNPNPLLVQSERRCLALWPLSGTLWQPALRTASELEPATNRRREEIMHASEVFCPPWAVVYPCRAPAALDARALSRRACVPCPPRPRILRHVCSSPVQSGAARRLRLRRSAAGEVRNPYPVRSRPVRTKSVLDERGCSRPRIDSRCGWNDRSYGGDALGARSHAVSAAVGPPKNLPKVRAARAPPA